MERTRDYYATLNRRLRASGATPPRSIEDAYRTHRARVDARAAVDPLAASTVTERYHARLLARYRKVIATRGGELTIEEKSRRVLLQISDRRDGLAVLHAEGWRHYSSRFGARHATLSYLCGADDNGPWAVRVPGTVRTVGDAVDWVTPAAVKAAAQSGRRVLRQGDTYAVESRVDRAASDAQALPRAHAWDPTTRTLQHDPSDARPHRPLHVPFPCRFFVQRVYAMRRGGGRARGD
jgi:hypothetical protein